MPRHRSAIVQVHIAGLKKLIRFLRAAFVVEIVLLDSAGCVGHTGCFLDRRVVVPGRSAPTSSETRRTSLGFSHAEMPGELLLLCPLRQPLLVETPLHALIDKLA